MQDHISAMVYALLSNLREWKTIEKKKGKLDEIFCYFNIEQLKQKDKTKLTKEILAEGCGNLCIWKQMRGLNYDIEILEKIDREENGINKYFLKTPQLDLVKQLIKDGAKYRMENFGPALISEYLKGVGVDIVKPDRHLCRIVGRLGFSRKQKNNEWETFEICENISRELGIPQREVDTILWQFCVEDKVNICTATPKCAECPIKGCPSRNA